MQTSERFPVPGWLGMWLEEAPRRYASDSAAMEAAIRLAVRNIREGAGGPFAALVINEEDGTLVAAGTNCVTSLGVSVAHAEIMALSLAQQQVGTWDLSRAGPHCLYTTCEPCVMCFGAILWSGIGRLVCGSGRGGAEAVGFDEGPRPGDWVEILQGRGIEVRTGLLEAEADKVLAEYAAGGGTIYNPGKGIG